MNNPVTSFKTVSLEPNKYYHHKTTGAVFHVSRVEQPEHLAAYAVELDSWFDEENILRAEGFRGHFLLTYGAVTALEEISKTEFDDLWSDKVVAFFKKMKDADAFTICFNNQPETRHLMQAIFKAVK